MNAYLHFLFGHPLAARLGWTLIHALWQGAAIALLLALLLRLLRQATHRHVACLVALLLVLGCSLITFYRVEIDESGVVSAGPSQVVVALLQVTFRRHANDRSARSSAR